MVAAYCSTLVMGPKVQLPQQGTSASTE